MMTRNGVLQMVNDIKLDLAAKASVLSKPDRKDDRTAAKTEIKDDMTITTTLGTLVSSLLAENTIHDNTQRITELRRMIDNNQYFIDTNKLAEKLAHTILKSK
tara:strand:+ start:426 stop:734 length:309 start_codon:yes stop_codon:yes gene_type:complete